MDKSKALLIVSELKTSRLEVEFDSDFMKVATFFQLALKQFH